MTNTKLLIGLAVGVGALWLLSGNANAAVAGGARGNCAPPNFWKPVGPGSTAGELALAKKYGDGSGYCAKQGSVGDAGTQPLGDLGATLTNAAKGAYATLTGIFGNTASSATPTEGPVTSPTQVADAGPANDPQFDPLGDS